MEGQHCVAVGSSAWRWAAVRGGGQQCVAVGSSAWRWAAVRGGGQQCVAVGGSAWRGRDSAWAHVQQRGLRDDQVSGERLAPRFFLPCFVLDVPEGASNTEHAIDPLRPRAGQPTARRANAFLLVLVRRAVWPCQPHRRAVAAKDYFRVAHLGRGS